MTAVAADPAHGITADPFGHPSVRWVERHDDPPGAWAALSDAERARLGAACDRRRAEFATARLCAREALATLGLSGTAPVTGEHGVPAWPHGVAGSITHSATLRAAAVARADDCRGVGIDVEPDRPLPAGVAPYVLRAEELAVLTAGWPVHVDRLLFCVKEAVYKIWSPMNPTARVRPGFHDVSVAARRDGTFCARLDPSMAGRCPTELPGRWVASGGLLRVLAVLPHADR